MITLIDLNSQNIEEYTTNKIKYYNYLLDKNKITEEEYKKLFQALKQNVQEIHDNSDDVELRSGAMKVINLIMTLSRYAV